ncbi:YybH family protein [Kordiimonas aquimaris]|uniref:YybH family protein n=1 Tax=Kordiimonas aquimaris TaxID=707591 RepID=UPI0021D0A6D4|nr:nuclear transport factor 2 family protein [Kordiimonas aquimaris]
MRLTMLFSAVAFMAASTTYANEDIQDDEAIRELRAASNVAMAKHDADKFVSFFDDDYIITYGSSVKSLSLEAETKSIRTLFSDFPAVKYTRTPMDIYVSNALPLAMENGTWVGGQTPDTTYRGRYTAAWRKVNGTWKIHNELFVTLACEGKDC